MIPCIAHFIKLSISYISDHRGNFFLRKNARNSRFELLQSDLVRYCIISKKIENLTDFVKILINFKFMSINLIMSDVDSLTVSLLDREKKVIRSSCEKMGSP